MGQQFVLSYCAVPGMPLERWVDTIRQTINDWSGEELDIFLDHLNELNPPLVEQWEDEVSEGNLVNYPDLIADSMRDAWEFIENHPRQVVVHTFGTRQYYFGGGSDYGEPEVMRHIELLAASGFDMLGNEP